MTNANLTTMTFLQWNNVLNDWDIILTEAYPNFTAALNASDKVWEKYLPLQKKGWRFQCTFGGGKL